MLRRADGTLLAGFSVCRDGVIDCGSRVATPSDPEFQDLSAVTKSEVERAAAADPAHRDNVHARAYLRARQHAETARDFAVRLFAATTPSTNGVPRPHRTGGTLQ